MTNINVTPGTGKVVSTETIGGSEYQNIKLIDGTASSTTPLAFVGGAIPVSILGVVTGTIVGSLPAGTALLGGITSVVGAVALYAQPDSFVSGSPSVITTTASVQVLGAPSGSLRNYVTHILVTNVGVVATTVNIVDAGQVIYSGYATASGGGFSATLPVPLKQPSTALGLFAATVATTSVLVAMSGYKAL